MATSSIFHDVVIGCDAKRLIKTLEKMERKTYASVFYFGKGPKVWRRVRYILAYFKCWLMQHGIGERPKTATEIKAKYDFLKRGDS